MVARAAVSPKRSFLFESLALSISYVRLQQDQVSGESHHIVAFLMGVCVVKVNGLADVFLLPGEFFNGSSTQPRRSRGLKMDLKKK